MKVQQREQLAWAFSAQQRQTYSTNLFQSFKGFSEFTSESLLQKFKSAGRLRQHKLPKASPT